MKGTPPNTGSSTHTVSPSRMPATSTPICMGRPLAWAMMHTWLVVLPLWQRMPDRLLKSSSPISEGKSSSATSMLPFAALNTEDTAFPVMASRICPKMSRTSSDRAARYSSSICPNMDTIMSRAASSAESSSIPASTLPRTLSASTGSSSISRCAAKTGFPSACFSRRARTAANASSKEQDCSPDEARRQTAAGPETIISLLD